MIPCNTCLILPICINKDIFYLVECDKFFDWAVNDDITLIMSHDLRYYIRKIKEDGTS